MMKRIVASLLTASALAFVCVVPAAQGQTPSTNGRENVGARVGSPALPLTLPN